MSDKHIIIKDLSLVFEGRNICQFEVVQSRGPELISAFALHIITIQVLVSHGL